MIVSATPTAVGSRILSISITSADSGKKKNDAMKMKKRYGLSKQYRGIAALKDGPGGWHCACCNPYGLPVRKMKPLAHRLVRRKKKQELLRSEGPG